MLERVEETPGIKPQRLMVDTAYGPAEMLNWVVIEKQIAPHIPVFDKTDGKPGLLGRKEFIWDGDTDCFTCPAGKSLLRGRRLY